MQKKYVSLSKLSKFLDNLKTTFAALGHKHIINDLTDYTVDTALSDTSTNPVQNKVLNEEFDSIATAMNALESAIDTKSDTNHNHEISDVTNLQTSLDEINKDINAVNTLVGDKADASHTHDDRYYTEDEIDTKLDEHTSDTTVHITSTERTNWNAAKTHADSAHAPSNAEKNQNAFSTIQIGIHTNSDGDADLTFIYPTIVADCSTDTVAFTGENVNINEVLYIDTKAIKFSVNNASTDVAGVVQLVDSYKNESTTLAPTANALRSAYKYLNDAYLQVSSYQTTLKNQIDTKASILTTINGCPLSDNITLTASDVDAYSKTEIDSYSFITTDDIDEICNASIVNAAELTF